MHAFFLNTKAITVITVCAIQVVICLTIKNSSTDIVVDKSTIFRDVGLYILATVVTIVFAATNYIYWWSACVIHSQKSVILRFPVPHPPLQQTHSGQAAAGSLSLSLSLARSLSVVICTNVFLIITLSWWGAKHRSSCFCTCCWCLWYTSKTGRLPKSWQVIRRKSRYSETRRNRI